MPISVYPLSEILIQSCGQSVNAPRGKAGVSLNAHTELGAKRQRSAREAKYRNRPIEARLGDARDAPHARGQGAPMRL